MRRGAGGGALLNINIVWKKMCIYSENNVPQMSDCLPSWPMWVPRKSKGGGHRHVLNNKIKPYNSATTYKPVFHYGPLEAPDPGLHLAQIQMIRFSIGDRISVCICRPNLFVHFPPEFFSRKAGRVLSRGNNSITLALNTWRHATNYTQIESATEVIEEWVWCLWKYQKRLWLVHPKRNIIIL